MLPYIVAKRVYVISTKITAVNHALERLLVRFANMCAQIECDERDTYKKCNSEIWIREFQPRACFSKKMLSLRVVRLVKVKCRFRDV